MMSVPAPESGAGRRSRKIDIAVFIMDNRIDFELYHHAGRCQSGFDPRGHRFDAGENLAMGTDEFTAFGHIGEKGAGPDHVAHLGPDRPQRLGDPAERIDCLRVCVARRMQLAARLDGRAAGDEHERAHALRARVGFIFPLLRAVCLLVGLRGKPSVLCTVFSIQ